MKNNDLPQEAIEARRAYWREYYRTHKEQAAERTRRFWIRKVEEMKKAAAEAESKNQAK